MKELRLQCSNCGKIESFNAKGNLPDRCKECGMIVGWLPPSDKIKDSGLRKNSTNHS